MASISPSFAVLARSHYVAELKRDKSGLGELRRLTHDEWDDSPTTWSSDRSIRLLLDRPQRITGRPASGRRPGIARAGGGGPRRSGRLPHHAGRQIGARRLFVAWFPADRAKILRIPAAGGPGTTIAETPALVHHRCGEHGGCLMVERVGDDDVVSELDPMKGKGAEMFRKPAGLEIPPCRPTARRSRSSDGSEIHTIRLVSRKGVLDTGYQDCRRRSAAVARLDARWRRLYQHPDLQHDVDAVRAGNPASRSTDRLTWLGEDSHTTLWSVPSHDGRRLAVFSLSETSDVWMVEGF